MRKWASGGKPDLVDRAGLAERLGVSGSTMNRWYRRSVLPEPDIRLGAQEVWLWDTIREWAKERSRFHTRERHRQAPDVVDLHALAQRLDLDPGVAEAWHQDGRLPEPDYRWEKADGWLWGTIVEWERSEGHVRTAAAMAIGSGNSPASPNRPRLAPPPGPLGPNAARPDREAATETPSADPLRDMELIGRYFSTMADELGRS